MASNKPIQCESVEVRADRSCGTSWGGDGFGVKVEVCANCHAIRTHAPA